LRTTPTINTKAANWPKTPAGQIRPNCASKYVCGPKEIKAIAAAARLNPRPAILASGSTIIAATAIETEAPKKGAIPNSGVALNRAAAPDSSGELGKTLSHAGREAVFPLLEKLILRAKSEGKLAFDGSAEAVGLYLDLLIGDQQIRRVIGRLPTPTAEFCDMRAKRAVTHLRQLLKP
jgi:hypothetical protein